MRGPPANDEASPDEGSSTDALLAEAARLQALPNFRTAARDYTATLAQFREALRLFNKLIANETRFRLVRYLVYLDADREAYGDDGGATYSRLLDLCSRRNEVSPRVLKTMLALLSLTGFVNTRRGTRDSRQKFYHPTPRMHAFVRQRVVGAARVLDVLEPECQRAAAFEASDGLRRFLVSSGRQLSSGEALIDRMPEFIAYYGGPEGAAPLVFSVMLADFDGTPLPSRAAIARRFGLSKTQVSNLIADGAQRGYLALDAKGVPMATDRLRAEFPRWIAIELAYHARHMASAS